MPTVRVIRIYARIINWRGKPRLPGCDNGPEYINQRFKKWCQGPEAIELLHIQPDKPTLNADVERFNRMVRHEYLNMHLFATVSQC